MNKALFALGALAIALLAAACNKSGGKLPGKTTRTLTQKEDEEIMLMSLHHNRDEVPGRRRPGLLDAGDRDAPDIQFRMAILSKFNLKRSKFTKMLRSAVTLSSNAPRPKDGRKYRLM